MEDQVALGLVFADRQRCEQIKKLLAFADIPCGENQQQAAIYLGDSPPADAGIPFIALDAPNLDAAQHLSSPLSLTQLLGAMAKVRGLVDIEGAACDKARNAAASYVGTSPNTQTVRELIVRASQQDVTVLVTGESGTGKEVVARALHAGSPRSDGPFVPINCGAIPSELLESELFGHERGAFTGAISQKAGRFELAAGGTLFLDEIGDLPFAMQVKLLRALEERSFERVGGTRAIATDVRVLAATNHDLESKIAAGEFREDLYYRLNVFPIELSPLRERAADVPLLINVLLERIQLDQGLTVRFSVDALTLLQQYEWPGNARELANLLQRLTIQFPNSLVRSVDLPKKYTEGTPSQSAPQTQSDEVLLPVNGIDLKDYLARLERSLIEQALEDANAVVARAADKLHIRRTTLVEKMRKHGIGRNLGEIQ